MAKSKLDMGHGFMKLIIKNQVDRDNYDKEVQASQITTSIKPIKKVRPERSKKPDRVTYAAPSSRKDPKDWNVPRSILFHLEYEDKKGAVHQHPVYKEDNLTIVSRRFGHDQGMDQSMIRALTQMLVEEKERLSSANSTDETSAS